MACVYLPPSIVPDTLENFYDYFQSCYDILTTENSDTAVIVAGDFNLTGNGFNPKILTKHCDLKQVIKKPTRNANILDLIFTNRNSYFEHPEILAPISSSDHNLIIWKSKIQIPRKNIIRKINVRPLKHSALQQFNEFLNQYNWSSVVTADSTDAKVEEFLKVTQSMIDNFFPEKTIKLHHDDKFFITAKIKGLMRKRDKAYKQGMTAPFKSLRNQIAAEIRNEKAKFYNEKIRPTYDRKPATWWNKINKLISEKRTSLQLF